MSGTPYIASAACLFPSGPSIALADTAIRSQLALLQYHNLYYDRCGAPVRISCFPREHIADPAQWGRLVEEVLTQLVAQLRQAQSGTLSGIDTEACQLWLVMPDQQLRPGLPLDLVEQITASAKQCILPWQHIHVVQGGHAAGVQALEAATALLGSNPKAMAVVVGVESALGPETLMWLEYQHMLHGAHHPRQGSSRANPYGRVPGEGAAAVALINMSPDNAHLGWARLLGASTAPERKTYATPQPCTGEGLTLAAKQALTSARQYTDALIGNITVDLNGEPYRADQYGFTALRLARSLHENYQRHVPALASGDLNAASVLTHVALAAHAQYRTPSSLLHLVLASSDDTLRGAALLGPAAEVAPIPEVRPWRSPSTSMA